MTQAAISTAKSLIGLPRPQLAEELQAFGIPEKASSMRANQISHWLYWHGLQDFEEMTNLSKPLRAELADTFVLDRPEIVSDQLSEDGTRKWVLRFGPGAEAETVYIPEEDRGTLCISSQVGCTLNCRFCHTGTQKLVRNLTAKEIISQVLVARDCLGEWPTPNDNRKITNLVMMGMGEPLYNFENVRDALALASDGQGISISRRRITLSTAGVAPMINRVGTEANVMLAISLHAVRDDIRDELVPLNKKYPIDVLLNACRGFSGLSNARRITFEYVMLKGVNDSLNDARELVRLLKGIPAKINLIPFNPWPGAPYECSSWDQIDRFADIVNDAGYASPIRRPRGRDIMAACGQLKSASVKMSAAELRRQHEAKAPAQA